MAEIHLRQTTATGLLPDCQGLPTDSEGEAESEKPREQALMRLLPAIAATLLLDVAAASAADPNTIFGQWIERFPNGSGMVTEFQADSMESYTVDPSGKRNKDVGKFAVTYRNLDSSIIGIDFKGGGGVMVLVKDGDTLILDFPGMGAHTLKKVSAQTTR